MLVCWSGAFSFESLRAATPQTESTTGGPAEASKLGWRQPWIKVYLTVLVSVFRQARLSKVRNQNF